MSIGIGFMDGWKDDDEDWEDENDYIEGGDYIEEEGIPTTTTTTTAVSTQVTAATAITTATLRYAPPWPELSPRADYWYGKLERVISGGLWVAKKCGRIEDYFVGDVLEADAWPESLDGKHFGRFSMGRGLNVSSRYKVGRLIVIVDLKRERSAVAEEVEEEGRVD